MSQVHHVTPTLLDLPVEILLDIFGYLDAYELVRARQVCNDVRQVINSSSALLYSIDLKYFNTIPDPLPGPDRTAPSLRKSLRQSEAAWQKAEYYKRNPIPIPYTPDMYRWSCGVLGFPVELEALQQISFFQPPLADGYSNTTSLHQWDCQIDSALALRLAHFHFSPAQDLVILIARALPGESYAYDIIFRSLSEDKVHPEAASAVAKALHNEVGLEFFSPYSPKSSIFGDYYGVLFRNVKVDGEVADFLQIWNWKSKDKFHCLQVLDPACKTMNFNFLTNEKLLVVNMRDLLLYSLDHSANVLQLTAKFLLPALQNPFEYQGIGFSPISLHTPTYNSIIAISIDISGGGLTTKPCFTLYVERNTLLELESSYTSRYGKASENSSSLPWSSWGSNYTRSFEESSYDPCKHSVFGFRSVSLVGDQNSQHEPRPLCIRDFNPHRVVDFKAGNNTRWNQRLIEGKAPNSSLFLEPLGSGLPYIETITEEKFLATDITMEANRVTLLSFEFVSTITMPQAGEQSLVEHKVVQSMEVLDFE
ncbi:hypothetical protein EDB19DRAFT_1198 [Suillus lakei]|nr:hypothetical protein EDB19DRAFT_1198 [Suillus lakei]